MTTRYRCTGCGNLTRFTVVASQRTQALYHYSVGGDLTIEDETVLDAHVEEVTCVWCGAGGDRIAVTDDAVVPAGGDHDGGASDATS